MTSAVVNASPLIHLADIGQVDLLRHLFETVAVPIAVADEIQAKGDQDPAARAIANATWLSVVEVPEGSASLLAWDLGAGETAVLSLALAEPGIEAIIDDLAARRCAKAFGVPVCGTLGLVLRAARRGIIADPEGMLTRLRDTWDVAGPEAVRPDSVPRSRVPVGVRVGEGFLGHLSVDLTARLGRGFSVRNIEQIRGQAAARGRSRRHRLRNRKAPPLAARGQEKAVLSPWLVRAPRVAHANGGNPREHNLAKRGVVSQQTYPEGSVILPKQGGVQIRSTALIEQLAGHADLSAHERYLQSSARTLEVPDEALPDLSSRVLPHRWAKPSGLVNESSMISARLAGLTAPCGRSLRSARDRRPR